MNWATAMKRVKELGPGWRLPTIEELKETLYPNMEKLPNLNRTGAYWSSTEYDSTNACFFIFLNGFAYLNNKNYTIYVRAVKTFDGESALGILLKDF